MVALTRTVRFSINPSGITAGANGYAGIPAMLGIGRYYQIAVRCKGTPDHRTGYLVDIRTVDRVVRSALVPIIAQVSSLEPTAEPASLMNPLAQALVESQLGPLVDWFRWDLTPYNCLEMKVSEPDRVVIRVSVDLAAAHRLHVDTLSPEENRAIFGKCNNPNGHGHNYRVECAVAVNPADEHPPFGVVLIEQILDQTIVQKFDHKHLNLDTEEFSAENGCNPSVENMARVFFGLLEPRIADANPGATLAGVTVWETDRTCGTYPG